MQAPNWIDFLQCSICTNKFNPSDMCPISLTCGHTICTRCLDKLKTRTCPYDKAPIRQDAETYPPNIAILQLLGHTVKPPMDNVMVARLSLTEQEHYKSALYAIGELAMVLKPLAEHGTAAVVVHLTKPMLKKLVTVVNCQVLEGDGRARVLRASRSIADRTVTELLVMHQNQQQLSTLLWTAVRNRGCQFLGHVMQAEALKLILRVLESGNPLSRKNIVLFVVQRLSIDYPQASKTSIGHVVQLLYRASCFNVAKRDDDSSLMQLKEEFRVYESLRREHDSQIVRMAMEAGLRICPEQWSTLLYGHHRHKSDMQSIIDKLVAQGAASSGLSDLIISIGRSQDPYQLSEKVLPHLETILKVQVDKDCEVLDWGNFASVMTALLATLQGFSAYMQIQSGRFKTGMCPYLDKPGGCPKGDSCTYAHTEEERDKFRSMVKPANKNPGKPRSGDQFIRSGSIGRLSSAGASGSRSGRYSGDLGPVLGLEGCTPLSSLGSIGGGVIHSGPNSLQESGSPEMPYYLHTAGGEQMGYRYARHSAPITAPLLSNQQDWVTTVQRGVATASHVLSSATEKGIGSYLPVATPPVPAGSPVDYQHKPGLSYPITHNTQLLDLDLLKMQHEAVKQSVEGYPRDLLPSSLPPTPPVYRSNSNSSLQDWLGCVPAEGQPSSGYTLPLTPSSSSSQHGIIQSYSMAVHQLLNSGVVQDSAAAAAISRQYGHSPEQSLMSSFQQLHLVPRDHSSSTIVIPSNTLSTSSMVVPSNAPLSTGTTVAPSNTLSTSSTVSSDITVTSSNLPPTSQLFCSSQASSSALAAPIDPSSICTSSAAAAGSSEVIVKGGEMLGQEDLEAEIRQLKEQLRESKETIQHQQAQLQYSGPQPSLDPQPLHHTHSPPSSLNPQPLRYTQPQPTAINPQPLHYAPPPALNPQPLNYAPSPALNPQPLHYTQTAHHQHVCPTSNSTVPATMLLASGEDPAHQISTGQGHFVSGHHYSEPILYSQQQIQAAMAALAGRGGVRSGLAQGTGTEYYNQVTPYAAQQWSGPQPVTTVGVYGSPSGQHSCITPSGTGYLMAASLPTSSVRQQVNTTHHQSQVASNTSSLPLSSGHHHHVASPLATPEHSDDSMLAAYIQVMEQNKLAAGHTTYQATPTYAATQGHYYYQQ